jgi:hypothetical protein
MPDLNTPESRVLLRDLVIFQVKLALDGIKDVVLSPLSIVATLLDLVLGPPASGPRLYRVLRIGERFDLWLNLYRPAVHAGVNPDGLWGESRAGDDTLLGRLEQWGRGPEPDEEDRED